MDPFMLLQMLGIGGPGSGIQTQMPTAPGVQTQMPTAGGGVQTKMPTAGGAQQGGPFGGGALGGLGGIGDIGSFLKLLMSGQLGDLSRIPGLEGFAKLFGNPQMGFNGLNLASAGSTPAQPNSAGFDGGARRPLGGGGQMDGQPIIGGLGSPGLGSMGNMGGGMGGLQANGPVEQYRYR